MSPRRQTPHESKPFARVESVLCREDPAERLMPLQGRRRRPQTRDWPVSALLYLQQHRHTRQTHPRIPRIPRIPHRLAETALRLRQLPQPAPLVQAASANALDWRPFTSTSILGRLVDGGLPKVIKTGSWANKRVRVVRSGANSKTVSPS